jgi:hypothetical protein
MRRRVFLGLWGVFLIRSVAEAGTGDFITSGADGSFEMAALTSSVDYAAQQLGYDRGDFGGMIHKMKPANSLSPADNVQFDTNTGDVHFNGVPIDNMHNYR